MESHGLPEHIIDAEIGEKVLLHAACDCFSSHEYGYWGQSDCSSCQQFFGTKTRGVKCPLYDGNEDSACGGREVFVRFLCRGGGPVVQPGFVHVR